MGRLLASGLRIVAWSALVLLLFLTGYVGYSLWGIFWRPVTFVDVATERTKLIAGLDSYQSIEEAKVWFASRALQWEVVSDSHLATGDNRPPMSIYTVSVKTFLHHDCSGELQVAFFNNRLMTTIFYPLEFDRYVERLEREEEIHFMPDPERPDIREARVWPYTRVWPYRDYGGKPYVGWSDTRLEEEEKLWIMRYA